MVNATFAGDCIVAHDEIKIGIAVGLPEDRARDSGSQPHVDRRAHLSTTTYRRRGP
jgi:hypothetical protein